MKPFEATFYVAGVQFHKLYDVINLMKEEDPVQLVPEPSNKYDKFAVRVEALDTMFGYIPKSHSQMVSRLIAFGKTLSAKIIKLSPESEPWSALKIEIKEEQND